MYYFNVRIIFCFRFLKCLRFSDFLYHSKLNILAFQQLVKTRQLKTSLLKMRWAFFSVLKRFMNQTIIQLRKFQINWLTVTILVPAVKVRLIFPINNITWLTVGAILWLGSIIPIQHIYSCVRVKGTRLCTYKLNYDSQGAETSNHWAAPDYAVEKTELASEISKVFIQFSNYDPTFC